MAHKILRDLLATWFATNSYTGTVVNKKKNQSCVNVLRPCFLSMLLEGARVPISSVCSHTTLSVGSFACQLMSLNSYDIGG